MTNIRQRRAWRRQKSHQLIVIADKTSTAIIIMGLLVIIAVIIRSI